MARSDYAAYEGEGPWPALVIFGLFAAGTDVAAVVSLAVVVGCGWSFRAAGCAAVLGAEAGWSSA